MRHIALVAFLLTVAAPAAWAGLTSEESAIVSSMGIKPEMVDRKMTAAQEKRLHDAVAKAASAEERKNVLSKLLDEYSAKWLNDALNETLLG